MHEFRPRFCPWPACPEHRRIRGRRISHFLCLCCRRSFSQNSFSLLHYLKRPELLCPVGACSWFWYLLDPASQRRGIPAMRLRLAGQPWDWRRVLGRRLFQEREALPALWQVLYRPDWPTPVLSRIVTHRLKHAY